MHLSISCLTPGWWGNTGNLTNRGVKFPTTGTKSAVKSPLCPHPIVGMRLIISLVLVVCDIRIIISICYRYDIGVNIEISIQFSIIFNCVGGVIAWAADIYKYA